MMNWKLISLFSFLAYAPISMAQEPSLAPPANVVVQAAPTAKVAKGKSSGGENLLDFEAEVIEGEKKRPELFLDIKAGDGNVGSGLYMRPNFDDFFAVDKKRRPRFVKAK